MPAGLGLSGDAFRIENALADLPIFPLPDAVLFPLAQLELHIFEPRYRAMLDACLEGNRCIAIAQILPGQRADGFPNVALIAGVGSIEAHQRLPDGRSHIVLQGRARVLLDELPFEPPFRRARARIVADVDDALVEAHDELTLVAAIRGFVEALRKEGATVSFERTRGVSAGELGYHAAQHLLFDARVKQEILEMRSPKERVQRIAEELMKQRALLGGPSSVRSVN